MLQSKFYRRKQVCNLTAFISRSINLRYNDLARSNNYQNYITTMSNNGDHSFLLEEGEEICNRDTNSLTEYVLVDFSFIPSSTIVEKSGKTLPSDLSKSSLNMTPDRLEKSTVLPQNLLETTPYALYRKINVIKHMPIQPGDKFLHEISKINARQCTDHDEEEEKEEEDFEDPVEFRECKEGNNGTTRMRFFVKKRMFGMMTTSNKLFLFHSLSLSTKIWETMMRVIVLTMRNVTFSKTERMTQMRKSRRIYIR